MKTNKKETLRLSKKSILRFTGVREISNKEQHTTRPTTNGTSTETVTSCLVNQEQ
jgi:hypothetical protein